MADNNLGKTVTEILAYHNISNNNRDPWATNPLLFKSEMQWVAEQGYKGISLKKFYEDIEQEKVFVLTFDDGYKDFFDVAMPILNKLGFSATIFIVSKLIGNISLWRKKKLQSALLNWDEVNEMIKIGYEIGSHGLYHSNFSHLSREELEQEIEGSKRLIEGKTGISIISFSYPWNVYNEQILDVVRKADYKYAAINGEGCKNDFRVDQFRLCRRSINNRNSVKEFIK